MCKNSLIASVCQHLFLFLVQSSVALDSLMYCGTNLLRIHFPQKTKKKPAVPPLQSLSNSALFTPFENVPAASLRNSKAGTQMNSSIFMPKLTLFLSLFGPYYYHNYVN